MVLVAGEKVTPAEAPPKLTLSPATGALARTPPPQVGATEYAPVALTLTSNTSPVARADPVAVNVGVKVTSGEVSSIVRGAVVQVYGSSVILWTAGIPVRVATTEKDVSGEYVWGSKETSKFTWETPGPFAIAVGHGQGPVISVPVSGACVALTSDGL